MSQENVDTVSACLEAARQGDLEAALSYYSEDVVWFNRPPEVGPYKGREGVVTAITSFTEHFEDYWFEEDQLVDGEDRVVLLWRQGGTGKGSGAPITEEGATVFAFGGGRISRVQVYSDRAEALEAGGAAG